MFFRRHSIHRVGKQSRLDCEFPGKVAAFGVILDATVDSIPVNGEYVGVTQTFTYLGSVIHSSTSCELEVNRRLGRAWSAMNSLDVGVWRCRYLCKRKSFACLSDRRAMPPYLT